MARAPRTLLERRVGVRGRARATWRPGRALAPWGPRHRWKPWGWFWGGEGIRYQLVEERPPTTDYTAVDDPLRTPEHVRMLPRGMIPSPLPGGAFPVANLNRRVWACRARATVSSVAITATGANATITGRSERSPSERQPHAPTPNIRSAWHEITEPEKPRSSHCVHATHLTLLLS